MSHALLYHPLVKAVVYTAAALLLSLGLLVLGIAFLVEGQSSAGLLANQLSPCPDTPNCVCSEERPAGPAYIDPLVYDGDARQAWGRARQAILDGGGKILKEDDNYLWAIYTTRWLHFVDDVELRLDEKQRHIHMRSASRVGSYDFRVNRNRLEYVRSLFHELQSG